MKFKGKVEKQQEQDAEVPKKLYVKVGLDQETEDFFKNIPPGSRITITTKDGEVIYDSAERKEKK